MSDKYTKAFEGILTPEELQLAAKEPGEFAEFLSKPSHITRGILRHTAGKLSDASKQKVIAGDISKADKKHIDYSEITNKLNNRTFVLDSDSRQLEQLISPTKLVDLFPAGQQGHWPILVLTTNSNLTSPQAFFKNFEAAKQIIPKIIGSDRDIVIAGSFFSERHLHANAANTFKRYGN